MATHLKHGRRKLLFALLLVAAAVAAAVFWQRTVAFADRPMVLDQAPRVLLVDHGDGLNAVVRKLRVLGVAQGGGLAWKALATQMGVAGKLQVGEYAVTAGLTPRQLLGRIARGEVIQRKFTIVEGWNFLQLRRVLDADTSLTHGTHAVTDALRRKTDDSQRPRRMSRSRPQT